MRYTPPVSIQIKYTLSLIGILLIPIMCFVNILLGFNNLLTGIWLKPYAWPTIPGFVLSLIILGPVLFFGSKLYGKYESAITNGGITSGRSFILYFLGLPLGFILAGYGGWTLYDNLTELSYPIPLFVSIPLFIWGVILLVLCFIKVIRGIYLREAWNLENRRI